MTIKAATYGAGRAALNKALSEHKAFTTGGALRGEEWTRSVVTNWDFGDLPTEHVNVIMIDHMAGAIAYVVWSYSTPIAWVLKDGTVRRPDVHYSVTTSKHQGHLYLL